MSAPKRLRTDSSSPRDTSSRANTRETPTTLSSDSVDPPTSPDNSTLGEETDPDYISGDATSGADEEMNKLIGKSAGRARSRSVPKSVPGEEGEEDWSVNDIDRMLSSLLDRKRRLEAAEKQVELRLLADFLRETKAQKEEALRLLNKELECLDEDLMAVQKRSIRLRQAQQGHGTQSQGDSTQATIPAGDVGSPKGPAQVPDGSNELQMGVVEQRGKKRSHEEMEQDLTAPLEGAELSVGSGITPQHIQSAQKQHQRIRAHIADLQGYYFDSRLRAQTSYTSDASHALSAFSASMTRFSSFSRFRTLATLHYADNFFNTSSSIVSSIEFDRDDEFFATAGVMKKIKIFDFGNVVWNYREDGLNYSNKTTRSGSIRDGGLPYRSWGRRDGSGRAMSPSLRAKGGRMGFMSANQLNEAEERVDIKREEDDESNGPDDVPRYPVREMACASKISCLSWNSYIKKQLISSDYEGIVTLWDASVGIPTTQFDEHEKRAWSVDFSQPDPMRFASGGDDTKVKIWSTNQKNSVVTVESKASVCSVKFNPEVNHQIVFGSADHHIHFYDLRNPSLPLHIFKGHKKAVSYVRFLNGDDIVSASTDCTLRQWSLSESVASQTSVCRRSFVGHTNEKNFVGLSVNSTGEFVACGSETNEVFAYFKRLPKPVVVHRFGNSVDAISGEEVPEEDPSQFVSSVCWKRNSPTTLIAANSQGRIKVMEMA
ncbi:RING finger and WD repeat domain-containing protein 2 [Borealophlyctis nickersoniae]|nr:RING finger and WD repeat domain-containing protein 2 [Borealophlyctis nickersoniae]